MSHISGAGGGGGSGGLTVGTTTISGGTNGDLLFDNAGVLGEESPGSLTANPTATAGPAAVNGSATTFMRSDAAPAIQLASASQFGIVEVDGTTITAAAGVISAAASGAPGGSSGDVQYNNGSGGFGGAANFTIVGGNPNVTNGNSYDYNGAFFAAIDTTHNNLFMGSFAGNFGTSSGVHNSAVGIFALSNLTTGQSNMAFGYNTLAAENSGAANVAIGANALSSSVGAGDCLAIGSSAMGNSGAGGGLARNVAIGSSAGISLTGTDSAVIGFDAGESIAGTSIAIGSFAGGSWPATQSVFIGYNSASAGTSGNHNTFVGYNSGSNITSGSNNTLLGTWPGPSGSLSGVIALSDGAATVQVDYNNTNSGAWTFAQNVFLPSGKKIVTPTAQLLGVIIANLPSPVAGMVAYVTDGDSGLAWGATAVNSGSGATKYLVWYNGTNWTVAGK